MNTEHIGRSLLLVAAVSFMAGPVLAAEVEKESSSVTTRTEQTGQPTVIQHIDSRMEPTALQVRERTDPQTGERERIVEPLIMERHERVLDTTIIQPAVLETTKTTQRRFESAVAASRSTKHFRRAVAHKRHPITHRIAYRESKHPVVQVQKEIVQTREITRQPIERRTFIPEPVDSTLPSPPQIIQKIESR